MTAILAAYDRATNATGVHSLDESGTIVGEGLNGDFRSWRDGQNERDDERLGPRNETTLRLGDRLYLRDANGFARELTGYLKRRALTDEFIESGAFIAAPDHATLAGVVPVDGRASWKLTINATGGEPETLYIDVETGLPLRLEYLDGDGPTDIDYSDWRDVDGHKFPFHSVITDGDHAFDIVETTTELHANMPVAPGVFAPLHGRTLLADAAQTVPLHDEGSHISVDVAIAGAPHRFLLDSGAQTILLDTQLAQNLGLDQVGALEVRGATRAGGLHVLRLPRIDIGSAHLDEVVATSLDLSGTTRGQVKLDGILGFPFFSSALVELDFAHHTMRFGPPGSFVPQGVKLPLDLDRGLMELTAQIDGNVDARMLVDTGDNAEMLLYRHFVQAHPAVAPFNGKTSFNYGIGGTTPTYLTQIDRLGLGSLSVEKPAVTVVQAESGAFADKIDDGNIGLGVLRRFVVTFDLAHNAIYFAPRRETVTTP